MKRPELQNKATQKRIAFTHYRQIDKSIEIRHNNTQSIPNAINGDEMPRQNANNSKLDDLYSGFCRMMNQFGPQLQYNKRENERLLRQYQKLQDLYNNLSRQNQQKNDNQEKLENENSSLKKELRQIKTKYRNLQSEIITINFQHNQNNGGYQGGVLKSPPNQSEGSKSFKRQQIQNNQIEKARQIDQTQYIQMATQLQIQGQQIKYYQQQCNKKDLLINNIQQQLKNAKKDLRFYIASKISQDKYYDLSAKKVPIQIAEQDCQAQYQPDSGNRQQQAQIQ